MSNRPHGYARYRLDQCRCHTCRAAVSDYNRRAAMAKTAGTWHPFVDAQPVRDHLDKLAAAGIGLRRTAALAGIDRKIIQSLVNGRQGRPPSRRVRPETATAILAVHPGSVTPARRNVVDGTGTARRVQALTAIGWSLSEQGRRIGWACQNYVVLAKGRPVTHATAKLVADLYESLSMTPGPAGYQATRSRNFAAAKGWAPPLAWDDDEIDNPNAQPSGWLGRPKRESPEEFTARLRPLLAQNLTWQEIADRLGVTIHAAKSRARRFRDLGLLADSKPQGCDNREVAA